MDITIIILITCCLRSTICEDSSSVEEETKSLEEEEELHEEKEENSMSLEIEASSREDAELPYSESPGKKSSEDVQESLEKDKESSENVKTSSENDQTLSSEKVNVSPEIENKESTEDDKASVEGNKASLEVDATNFENSEIEKMFILEKDSTTEPSILSSSIQTPSMEDHLNETEILSVIDLIEPMLNEPTTTTTTTTTKAPSIYYENITTTTMRSVEEFYPNLAENVTIIYEEPPEYIYNHTRSYEGVGVFFGNDTIAETMEVRKKKEPALGEAENLDCGIATVGEKTFCAGKNRMKWGQALDFCHINGLSLATIMNEKEQYEVVEGMDEKGIDNLWLSAIDLYKEKDWRWFEHSSKVEFAKWGRRENRKVNRRKNCAYIESTGKWLTTSCSQDKNIPLCVKLNIQDDSTFTEQITEVNSDTTSRKPLKLLMFG